MARLVGDREMRLILGVLDLAYSDASNGGGETTTGDVAAILEKNYAVMGTFFELYQEKIAQWLADDMAASIQTLVNSGGRINTATRGGSATHRVSGVSRTVGGEQSGTLTYGADQKIETAFRQFIFGGEMQRIVGSIGGTVSAAAVAGKSKRFKSGYTKGRKERVAFVDSGLYVSAFRAWTEENG